MLQSAPANQRRACRVVMYGFPLCLQPPTCCQRVAGYSYAYTYQNITDKAIYGGGGRCQDR